MRRIRAYAIRRAISVLIRRDDARSAWRAV
jgi:hypothetical protein